MGKHSEDDENSEDLDEGAKNHGFNTIFHMMDKGDKTLADLGEEQVLLVGLSRIGKSTAWNSIMNRPMIGLEKDGQVHYVNVGTDGAPVTNGMISLTLIANKGNLNGINVLDMAGFGDKRDHIGVFGVSYCLQRVFSVGTRFRFVIVISEEAFRTGGRNDVIKTLQAFLSMFRIKGMKQEVKEALFNSVVLMVSRANDIYDRGAIISSFLNEIIDPASKISKRELIHELLSKIYRNDRIYDFPLAQPNRPCAQSNIFDALEPKGWKSFNLPEMDKNFPQKTGSHVKLPFETDYDSLGRREKKRFQQSVKKKIDSYQEFGLILQKFLQTAMVSQYLKEIDYKSTLELIQRFLEEHDDYESEKNIKATDLSSTPSIKIRIELNKSIRALLSSCSMARQKEYHETSKEYMLHYLMEKMAEVIDILFCTMCPTNFEQKLILRFKYAVLRGLKELCTISEIDPEIAAEAYSRISDSLTTVSEALNQTQENIWQKFFLRLPPSFSTEEYSVAYKMKIDDYSDQFLRQHSPLEAKKFRQFKYLLKLTICISLKRNADFYPAIKYGYEGAMQILEDIEVLAASKKLDTAELLNDNEISQECLKVNHIFFHVIDSLLRSNLNAQLSLDLCLYFRNDIFAIKVYESLLNKEKDSDDQSRRKEILEDFFNFCVLRGLNEKAQLLLMERRDLEFDSVQKVDETIEKLKNFYNESAENRQTAKDNFYNRIIPQRTDEPLKRAIENIKDLIENPPSNISFTQGNSRHVIEPKSESKTEDILKSI